MVAKPIMRPSEDFWHGRRVLVTGHTGFKGAWLVIWLAELGAEVTGVALPPDTQPNLFTAAGVGRLLASHHELDLARPEAVDGLAAILAACRPEVVVHLAAQALVRRSYREPAATWASNVLGTVHLLEAIRRLAEAGGPSPRAVVAVTTDKVYANREWPYPYRETDALGGIDPYSASKAACELAIASYRDAFLRDQRVALASARAGNVIGGGDWAEDRLLPDAARAWSAGEPLLVRRPQAVRPWQHVLEPLAGYLALAQALWQHPDLADAYNFGPDPSETATARQVAELAAAAWGEGARMIWAEAPSGPHEAGTLTLETAKARTVLGVQPRWGLAQAVQRTMAWYRAFSAGGEARALCLSDIAAYDATGTPEVTP